jgi:hypothetical protein
MQQVFVFLTVLMFLTMFGCQQQFEPNGAYDERLVIYAILRMDTDTQYVRVYSTYDPHKHNPLTHSTDTEVTDATVIVSDGTKMVQFHDTLVVRADTTTVYGTAMHTYVAYNLKPSSGKVYTLTVDSPSKGKVNAAVETFIAGNIYLTGNIYKTLSAPKEPTEDTAIVVRLKLGPKAPAYIARFMIRYRQLVGTTWITKTIEVPYFVQQRESWNDYTALYPSILPRGFNATSDIEGEEIASFSIEAYVSTIRYLRYSVGASRLEFIGAYFTLNQVDQGVYAYYSSTHQVSDKISIRLDQIDYSNISGGYGLFGMMTHSESQFIVLPKDIDLP